MMDAVNRAIAWVRRHVFLRSEHVVASAGAADRGRPILTDANGQIDATLLAAAAVSGTWTPTLSFGGASTDIAYATRVGTYIKVGSMVLFSCYLVLSNKGSATGDAFIGGLPYSAKNDGCRYSYPIRYYSFTSSYVQLVGQLSANNTRILVLGSTGAATGQDRLQDSAFSDTSVIVISGWYRS